MKIKYQKAPRYIQLETTIICNGDCWFCPQKDVKRRPVLMEEKTWKKIIDDTRGLGIHYRPFLLNEPFSDRRLAKIIRYIKEDPTAIVEFNSNGEIATPERAAAVIEAGVDKVYFSVDGVRKETFTKSRGLNYDKVYANVANFITEANKADREIETQVRMIRFPGTEEEQKEFKAYWQAYNPTKILFTDLYAYPWSGQTEPVPRPCRKIVDEMFFYVDGRATLCCWDDSERQIVGDVSKEKVLDIWNGQIMNHCRKLLDEGRRSEILLCSRCDAFKEFDFEAFYQKQAEEDFSEFDEE